jgi:uncharacterized membrane protein
MSGVYDTDAQVSDEDLEHESATHGWIAFAWVTLAVVGVFNVIEGVLAVTGSAMYEPNADYVVGGLTFWGVIILVLGNVQLVAAMCVLQRVAWGRWFGIGAAITGVAGQLLFVQAYPWWSAISITMDAMVVYALTVRADELELR